MKKISVSVLLLSTLVVLGCDDPIAPKVGCTDAVALNYDVRADEDDGSCQFSKVIFYKALDGPPVQVTVDGQAVGTITAFYPGGPGNCSAPGNATFQLQDSRSHDWNGQSGQFLASGTVRASRTECIRVRVF